MVVILHLSDLYNCELANNLQVVSGVWDICVYAGRWINKNMKRKFLKLLECIQF